MVYPNFYRCVPDYIANSVPLPIQCPLLPTPFSYCDCPHPDIGGRKGGAMGLQPHLILRVLHIGINFLP